MTFRSILLRIVAHDDVNFVLSNLIPRRLATLFVGWVSRIERDWVVSAGLFLWRLCTSLDLREAKLRRFRSLREIFIRELRDGTRPIDIDPDALTSPCDAIVGAHGNVRDGTLLQIKGSTYSLQDLLQDAALERRHANGSYVTLRLTSGMYHRFHAPHDCLVRQVNYVSGETWNVNPVALQRIPRVFCRNERAVVQCELAAVGAPLTLVPVAAVLVASIRLHCLPVRLHLRHRGPNRFQCEARYRKGQEMGWFELGSTIVVLAPVGCVLAPHLHEGARIQMGETLLRLPRKE